MQDSLLSAVLDAYLNDHTSPESPLLAALNRETNLKVMGARMISGALQGRLLALLSRIKRPQRILEIGTYTGYSALCLAEGLAPQGELHSIEKNPERESLIQKYFKASPYSDQLSLHIGDALDLIPKISGPFDIVFIDADKKNYSKYYHLVLPKLSPGGLILADNVLWKGKVTHLEVDAQTKALKDFNDLVQQDPNVENILLPLRDGIMLIQSLK